MAVRKSSRSTSKNRKKSAKAPSRSAKTTARGEVATKKSATKSRPSRTSRNMTRDEVPAGDREVTIDRRRGGAPQLAAANPADAAAAAPKLERRKKVNRRRQIDPTTCERDYTDQEVEFMNAIDDYKRTSGRMFPTCSEVLEVLRGLGYVKLALPMGTMQDATSSAPAFNGSAESTESEADLVGHETL